MVDLPAVQSDHGQIDAQPTLLLTASQGARCQIAQGKRLQRARQHRRLDFGVNREMGADLSDRQSGRSLRPD